MTKAADRSSKMSTEDLEAALASLRASVTESRAVSVEWPSLERCSRRTWGQRRWCVLVRMKGGRSGLSKMLEWRKERQ